MCVPAVSCVLHVVMMMSLRSLSTEHHVRTVGVVNMVDGVGHRQRGTMTNSGLPANWRHGRGNVNIFCQ